MASALVLTRLVSSNILRSSLRPVASAASSRLFNTNVAASEYDDDDQSLDVDRRFDRPLYSRGDFSPFSDLFDPFSTRRVSPGLNMMDSPIFSGIRRGWGAKETGDGLYLKMDMPGLGKEDVKVAVEQNTLTIKGEGQKESEDDESARNYFSRIELPEKLFKADGIKAEMKNGVLKLFLPKIKEEERADVFHVKVE